MLWLPSAEAVDRVGVHLKRCPVVRGLDLPAQDVQAATGVPKAGRSVHVGLKIARMEDHCPCPCRTCRPAGSSFR